MVILTGLVGGLVYFHARTFPVLRLLVSVPRFCLSYSFPDLSCSKSRSMRLCSVRGGGGGGGGLFVCSFVCLFVCLFEYMKRLFKFKG